MVYLLESTLDQQLSSFLPYSNKNSTVNVTLVQKSTSVAVSGDFALEFRGQRTGYLPYTSSAYAVEAALEALSTIGSVAVSRTAPDENGGATWSITFLTELGDVPMLTADDLDMTGTAVSATTFLQRQGVFPPFNSLDPLNGLPLGSAAITDLADLDLTISKLETRVPYYVRVAAVNALGQGPWTMTTPPCGRLSAFRPGVPVNVSLAVLDATSLRLSLEDPVWDGGDAATVPRKGPAPPRRGPGRALHERDDGGAGRGRSCRPGGTLRGPAHPPEARRLRCTGRRRHVALETQLSSATRRRQLHVTFDGLTTRSIAYNVPRSSRSRRATNINDVTVTLTGVGGGATTACIDGGDGCSSSRTATRPTSATRRP